jgi:signal transduction histidine kinase/Flp pilus assembly protein TadD
MVRQDRSALNPNTQAKKRRKSGKKQRSKFQNRDREFADSTGGDSGLEDVRSAQRYLEKGQRLLKKGERDQAIKQLRQAAKLAPDDATILRTYGAALSRAWDHAKALNLFNQALELEPDNDTAWQDHAISLSCQASELGRAEQYDAALPLYDQALALDPTNQQILRQYAMTVQGRAQELMVRQRFPQALELLLKAVNHKPRDHRLRTTCANVAVEAGELDLALELLQDCLKTRNKDVVTLNSYGNALAGAQRYEEAFERFEQSLDLDGNNVPTLNSYGNALAGAQRYEEAFERFEQCLKLDGNHVPTRFAFAHWLEHKGHYSRALEQLEAINLPNLPVHEVPLIKLYMGRLCYFLQQPEQGRIYLDQAIAESEDSDRSTLYAAHSLLVTNPRSTEAITRLQSITKKSPRYRTALQMLGIHADSKTAYNLFRGSTVSIERTEMLYRSLYHKIGNEIMVLKSISDRILYRSKNQNPNLQEISQSLEDLQIEIQQQRAMEKEALEEISPDNYQQVLQMVSDVAHNIADTANNSLFAIESKTRRAQRSLAPNDPLEQDFNKLLQQLELTQEALNDLKSINEGTQIHRTRFPVKTLFEKWNRDKPYRATQLEHARIYLDMRNPDSEVDGNEPKLKSMINELVENAIKHNPLTAKNPKLKITIRSEDQINPPDITSPSIPGDRRYLKIMVKDNGKGVPKAKKNWIFQPLHTTAPQDQSSGLGLSIIRQTIEEMGGTINETGTAGKGACFNIFLPYPS